MCMGLNVLGTPKYIYLSHWCLGLTLLRFRLQLKSGKIKLTGNDHIPVELCSENHKFIDSVSSKEKIARAVKGMLLLSTAYKILFSIFLSRLRCVELDPCGSG
jgi:hypothetical protein